jgi:ABC-type lipoprotein export system ATPase subunit
MSASTSSIAECRGVARTFGTGAAAVVAVHGVDCRVEAGARIAITGRSGSGKSTLLHLLAGLDQPTVGTIVWPALGDRAQLRPGKVAVVFQAGSLVPSLDVTENVALPLILTGIDPETARAEALQALARLGLSDIAGGLPDELSGGQAQRVAVARALAGRPLLILADEPTGQLDHVTGAEVVRALLETADDLGAALLVATHDPAVSGRVRTEWRMVDGRIAEGVS